MLVVIFGNMMLIVIICCIVSLCMCINMFILNQVCVDVGVVLFCMLFLIVMCFIRDWVFGDGFCQLNGFMYILFEVLLLFMFIVISIEKYFFIVKFLVVVIMIRLMWIMIFMMWFIVFVLVMILLIGFIIFVYKFGEWIK